MCVCVCVCARARCMAVYHETQNSLCPPTTVLHLTTRFLLIAQLALQVRRLLRKAGVLSIPMLHFHIVTYCDILLNHLPLDQ